jgi:hypothetical protein
MSRASWVIQPRAFGGKLPAMQKGFRRKAAVKSEGATTKEAAMPPEIAQLIKGRAVRIDPDRYFSKELRAKLPLIHNRLTESAPNTFTLEPKLFEDFLNVLRSRLEKKADQTYAQFRPSDWISLVLSSIATGMYVNRSSPDHFIDRESVSEEFALPPELNPLAPQQSSSSEEHNSHTVSLNVSYTGGEDEPLSLRISIDGEPVRTFLELEAVSERPTREKQALQRRAKKIWDVLSEKIASRLGVMELPAGRPITDTPQLAAFLRDHYGYTPLQMAQKLCSRKQCKDLGRHTADCRDRLRKAADQHWKNEKKKYTELARVAQHSAKADSRSRN